MYVSALSGHKNNTLKKKSTEQPKNIHKVFNTRLIFLFASVYSSPCKNQDFSQHKGTWRFLCLGQVAGRQTTDASLDRPGLCQHKGPLTL